MEIGSSLNEVLGNNIEMRGSDGVQNTDLKTMLGDIGHQLGEIKDQLMGGLRSIFQPVAEGLKTVAPNLSLSFAAAANPVAEQRAPSAGLRR